jgi:hypothetical protein
MAVVGEPAVSATRAITWIAVVLLIFGVILAIGFGSGVWPFTQLPPNQLVH